MPTLTLRRAAVAAALPLALGSLAACGDNGSSATAADPKGPAASSAPIDAARAEPHAGSAVSRADFLKLMTAAAQKITTDKVSMTMDTAGQTITMDGAMDLTGDQPAVQLNMDMGSAGLDQVEMR